MAYRFVSGEDSGFDIVDVTGHVKLRSTGMKPSGEQQIRLDIGDKKIPVQLERERIPMDDGSTQVIIYVSLNPFYTDNRSWYTRDEYAEIEAQGRLKEINKLLKYKPSSKDEIEEAFDVMAEAAPAWLENNNARWGIKGQVLKEVILQR